MSSRHSRESITARASRQWHNVFVGKVAFCTQLAHSVFAGCPTIGGQAILEGVMMRNGDVYSLAVRHSDGRITARRYPWFSLTRRPWLKMPFVRGFPILLETLINGIKALNRSAEAVAHGEAEELSNSQLVGTLVLAFLMAIGLFVVVPHLLSLVMLYLHLSGDVEGFSFHFWDGFFKCCIFMAYIKGISCIPEIHRVFQYHGAEHKTIHAFETGAQVNLTLAKSRSRLHPRCGTTFLLFVIAVSIMLHAIIVPLLLNLYTPDTIITKHILTISVKLLLIAPISALAYELIRYAARLPEGIWATILRTPGLALQNITTAEPDESQLEVALVALREALGVEDGIIVHTAPYTLE